MLQGSPMFDKLDDWLSVSDVQATTTCAATPSPDERYSLDIVWRFRSKQIGHASVIIEPVFGTDEFRFLWVILEWVEDWQNKGLYSELVEALTDKLPAYGVTSFVAAPRDSTAEAILASAGFEWVDNSFKLDLEGERVKEWRAYRDGKTEQPAWRHAILASAGLLGDSETI